MFLLRLALEVQSVANAVVSSIIMTRRVGVTKARQSSTLKQENQHLFPGRPALVGKGRGGGLSSSRKPKLFQGNSLNKDISRVTRPHWLHPANDEARPSSPANAAPSPFARGPAAPSGWTALH